MASSRMRVLAEKRLTDAGFYHVHVYQPVHMFVPNGRKLARCPEPCDPWLMFGSLEGRCYNAVGDDPMAAAAGVIEQAAMPAAFALGVEIERLASAIRG